MDWHSQVARPVPLEYVRLLFAVCKLGKVKNHASAEEAVRLGGGMQRDRSGGFRSRTT
jgi:hypothetical protein